MTKFRIGFEVDDTELQNLLSNLSSEQMANLSIATIKKEGIANGTTTPAKTPNQHATRPGMDQALCMGNLAGAPAGEVQAAMLVAFEKLEGQQGIGSITRRMLEKHCKDKKVSAWPKEALVSLIDGGWLEAF